MSDLIDRAVAEIQGQPSPVAWEDVLARVEPGRIQVPAVPGHKDSPRSRRRLTAVLVAATAVVMVVAVLWMPKVRDGDRVRTDTGPTADLPSSTTPSTPDTTAGPAGDGVRSSAVTGASPAAYVVWGGEAGEEIDRLDGFTVDLDTGAITPIPDAPIEPAYRTSGVWTGDALIVWSGDVPGRETATAPAAATWRPGDGWRTIAAPPTAIASGGLAAVWTDDQVVAVTNAGAAATYDPTTDRWNLLPDVPGRTDAVPSLVWTGDEAVLWMPDSYAGPYPAALGGPLADRGWRWSPGARSWEPLPDLPEGHRTQYGSLVWTGRDVLVWGQATGGSNGVGVGVGASWRPSDDAWRALPPSPQTGGRWFEGTPGSQSLTADPDAGVVVLKPLDFSGQGSPTGLLIFDTRTGAWAASDLELGGYNPSITLARRTVLVPSASNPVVGQIPA